MNLFKALSYKEWIKTRRLIGVLLVMTLAVLAYSFIEITHNIRLNGAVEEWYGYLFLDYSLPWVTLALPLISGIALGLVQFVPEMVNKRMKLTLHLPANENAIVSSMLEYGLLVLIILFSITACVYAIGLSVIFSREITLSLLTFIMPSFVSGLSSYCLISWICFEPRWRQRVLNTFVAVAILSALFVSTLSGAYLHFAIPMLLILFISFALPFYSVLRFKHGVI